VKNILPLQKTLILKMENAKKYKRNAWSPRVISLYKDVLEVKSCPYCNCKEYYVHGRYKQTIRYRCRSCRRTFLPSTGSSIHYLHKKDTFIEYAEVVRTEGLHTVKSMTTRFGISKLTAFDWRHKILASVPPRVEGYGREVICYDLWFLFNQKGRRGVSISGNSRSNVIMNKEKYKTKLMTVYDYFKYDAKIATVGSLTPEIIITVLKEKFRRTKVFMSYANEDFVNFSSRVGAKFKKVEFEGYNEKTSDTIKTFKNQLSRLKTWLTLGMNGVSTKYLQFYGDYFVYTRQGIFDALSRENINQKFVWRKFTGLEFVYRDFLNLKTSIAYENPIKRYWKTSLNFYIEDFAIPY